MRRGVDEEELNRTKEYLQGTFRLGLESVSSKMNFLGESYVNYRHVRSPKEILEGINAVQVSDVHALVSEILTEENMTLAVVAPNKLSCDKNRWLEAVQFVRNKSKILLCEYVGLCVLVAKIMASPHSTEPKRPKPVSEMHRPVRT